MIKIFYKYNYSVSKLLTQQLTSNFNPSHLEIINESKFHSVPKDSETHFKLIIVSQEFLNQPLLKRQQAVYQSIDNLRKEYKIHAISMITKTEDEWNQDYKIDASPTCRGGSKIK